MSILRYGDVFRSQNGDAIGSVAPGGASSVMPTKGSFRIHRSSWDRQGWAQAKHTAPYGMGSEPRSFFFPSLVVPLQAGADELLHRSGLAWSPLSIAETRP